MIDVKDIRGLSAELVINEAYTWVESETESSFEILDNELNAFQLNVFPKLVLNPETKHLRRGFETVMLKEMENLGLPEGFKINDFWPRGGLIDHDAEGNVVPIHLIIPHFSKTLTHPDVDPKIASIELSFKNSFELNSSDTINQVLNNPEQDYQLSFEIGGTGFWCAALMPGKAKNLEEYFQDFGFADKEFPMRSIYGGVHLDYLIGNKFPDLASFGKHVQEFELEAQRFMTEPALKEARRIGYLISVRCRKNPVFSKELY
ncbi:MAG: hypothetical protein GOU97_03105 [Nanoarchaeota archaeon]|nr:hypothetical protein [Nanoarchaeota archaeon]